MTSKEAYNYLLGLLELEDDIRWPLVKESMDKIKELIDQQSNPTFSECIKEWEDRGWEVYVSNREIELLETNSLNTISIDKRDKCYWCNYYLSFELHHLLSKTIKVLEEMKDG